MYCGISLNKYISTYTDSFVKGAVSNLINKTERIVNYQKLHYYFQ